VVEVSGLCNITSDGGCVQSPNWPEHYGNFESCIITGVPAVPLQVRFFEVESGFECENDYLRIDSAAKRGRTLQRS